MKTIFTLLLLTALTCSAQNFAVLLSKDDPKASAGMPTNWPTRVQPIGDAKELPEAFPPPWRFATKAQVEKWKSDHAAEIEAFLNQPDPAVEAVKTEERQIHAALKQIAGSSGTLTGAQLSAAVRKLAEALLYLIKSGRIDITQETTP
jgi:hypothetical protein